MAHHRSGERREGDTNTPAVGRGTQVRSSGGPLELGTGDFGGRILAVRAGFFEASNGVRIAVVSVRLGLAKSGCREVWPPLRCELDPQGVGHGHCRNC